MAVKKQTKKTKTVQASPLETFTTRVPLGLHTRLKVAAGSNKTTVQALVQRGIEMALGEL